MTTVVIPWRPTNEDRTRALAFVEDHYLAHHPDWPIVLADLPRDVPWCKAKAVIPAVAQLDPRETVVIADGDCLILEPQHLGQAVDAVGRSDGWAMPHLLVHRLSAESTRKVLAGASPVGLPLEANDYDRRPREGWLGGGIVVMRAETFLRVPLDARFVGWGQEDQAWALALNMIVGPVQRGDADLYHLWHEPQPRRSRGKGAKESTALVKRYRATRTPAERQALVDESKALWRADAR